MTVTSTTTHPAPTTSPGAGSRRRGRWVLTVAGIAALLAAVALTVWALTTSTPTHTRPATGPTVVAPGDPYAQFCANNSDLCVAPQPATVPVDPYAQFCANNSDLCAIPHRH